MVRRRVRGLKSNGRDRSPTSVVCMEPCEPRRMLSTDVLTWHNNLARDGANLTETQLTPLNVRASTFGKKLSLPVDGQIYAQPLYVSNLALPNHTVHNVVYV